MIFTETRGNDGQRPAQVSFSSGAFPLLVRHIQIDSRDFFWLANNTEENQSCELTIDGARGQASVWDCVTGAITPIASKTLKAASEVTLGFRALEGFWLVFESEKKALASPVHKIPAEMQLLTVDGPWQVSLVPDVQPVLEYPVEFPSEYLKPGGVTKTTLQDWRRWSELDKKFVGHIDYETTFVLNTLPQGELVLDLGTVHHMAKVWLNGKEVGTRLWGPYRLNISPHLQKGKNTLRIRVGNLVQNNYDPKTQPHGSKQEKTSNSGLLGPVTLKYEE